jgi:DNA-binding transcriptional LysR family regulator
MKVEILLSSIEDGSVDVYISHEIVGLKERGLGLFELQKDRECCLMSPDDPLVCRESISVRDLTERTLALPREKLTSVVALRRCIASENLSIKIVDIDQEQIIRMINGLEDIVTTIPESLAPEFEPLVAIPFKEEIYSRLGIVYSLEHGAAVQEFLEVAQEFVAEKAL